MPKSSTVERLWKYVDTTGECWVWTGLLSDKGYGRIRVSQSQVKPAHRLMYEITYGPIPDGMHVCHHCDNRACVRPDHLFLGTHADNMADMRAKGRSAKGSRNGSYTHPESRRWGKAVPEESRLRGERNPSSKISENEVREIRALYANGGISQREIAKRYGLSQAGVSVIVAGKRWAHLDDASCKRVIVMQIAEE